MKILRVISAYDTGIELDYTVKCDVIVVGVLKLTII